MYDWLIGQKVYDGSDSTYHRFTITGVTDNSLIIETASGRVESYSIKAFVAHLSGGFIKLLPESWECSVEKQATKFPTAEEAYKSTLETAKKLDFEPILARINAAIKVGEFNITVPDTYTPAELIQVKVGLDKLGYVVVKVPSFVGEDCLVISWRKYD